MEAWERALLLAEKRELEQCEELLAAMAGPRASQEVKEARLPDVQHIAYRHFRDEMMFEMSLYKDWQVEPACKELFRDELLENLHRVRFLERENPRLTRRVCPTCGKLKTERKFYTFGSRSCRACNVRGATPHDYQSEASD